MEKDTCEDSIRRERAPQRSSVGWSPVLRSHQRSALCDGARWFCGCHRRATNHSENAPDKYRSVNSAHPRCASLILPRISGRVKSSDILSRRRKRVMQKVQKTYTTEFKREAVHLAQTSGKPITQIARELGISDTSIHQWRKELTEHGPEAFPGSGHQTAQEEELRRLKRELERTQKERDILKKALAIFSQNPL